MSTDEEENVKSLNKRRGFGRMREVAKKLRLQSHETGENCYCKRLRCFENITEENRRKLIRAFNQLPTSNEQNSYLSDFIECSPVAQRRSRKSKFEAKFRDRSYRYKIKVPEDEGFSEVQVCYKAFMSVFGISKKHLQTLQNSLKRTGRPHIDGRGKHNNRPRKLPDATIGYVFEHIKTFKGKPHHYSVHDPDKTYVPESVSVKKMHNMYMELHPNNPISYESYRHIFSSKCNSSSESPDIDTGRTYDEGFSCSAEVPGDWINHVEKWSNFLGLSLHPINSSPIVSDEYVLPQGTSTERATSSVESNEESDEKFQRKTETLDDEEKEQNVSITIKEEEKEEEEDESEEMNLVTPEISIKEEVENFSLAPVFHTKPESKEPCNVPQEMEDVSASPSSLGTLRKGLEESFSGEAAKKSSVENDDKIDAFCRSIGKQLRQLPEEYVIEIMADFQAIVSSKTMQYVKEQFNHTCNAEQQIHLPASVKQTGRNKLTTYS